MLYYIKNMYSILFDISLNLGLNERNIKLDEEGIKWK